MEDYRISHVNTGCLYQSDGQKITIAHGKGFSYFFDHSRMVDGKVIGEDLTNMEVIKAYVKGMYERMDLRYPEREPFLNFYKTAQFTDISPQYRSFIRYGI